MDLSKKKEIKSRRLLSLDTLRGFGIFYMSLLHPLVFRVFEQKREQKSAQYLPLRDPKLSGSFEMRL